MRTGLTCGCSAWSVSKQQLQEIDTCYKFMLWKMIRNGPKQTKDYKYIITDKKLHSICKTTNVSDFIKLQQSKYLAHIIRKPDCATTKILTFEKSITKKRGRPSNTLSKNVCQHNNLDIKQFSKAAISREF